MKQDDMRCHKSSTGKEWMVKWIIQFLFAVAMQSCIMVMIFYSNEVVMHWDNDMWMQ